MDNPRAEKVAVVDEVRGRLASASASVVTEYRGLTVAQLAELRRQLTAAGGDYKVYKNTLVRRAVAGTDQLALSELLVGPTAIAFVRGELSAVAKALRDFSRTNPQLVVKGGMLDGTLLSPGQLGELADLPPREVLLARLAGAFSAPLAQLAGLLEALPRNLAYGIKALVDQGGAAAGSSAAAPSSDGGDGGAPVADAAGAADAAVAGGTGEVQPAAGADEAGE